MLILEHPETYRDSYETIDLPRSVRDRLRLFGAAVTSVCVHRMLRKNLILLHIIVLLFSLARGGGFAFLGMKLPKSADRQRLALQCS